MDFSGPGQAEAFDAFIAQDDYLSDRRGEYAERYGALAPWRGRWDLKFLQDYNFKVSEDKTHTIQFSMDVLNLGNLISSEWGLIQQPNNIQPIGVSFAPPPGEGGDGEGEPIYSFDPNLEETYGYDASLMSRWQIQFGLRYIF